MAILGRAARSRASQVIVALLASGSQSARGEGPTPDSAIAEELYARGRAQMAAHQYEEACASFAESLRVDTATGTLLNLAACHERMDKLATAWAEFRASATAAQRDGRPDRVQFARERLAAIEPRLAQVTLSVTAPERGMVVTLDGAALGRAAWGIPIPIDAGAHEVVAQRTAGSGWRGTFSIADGQNRIVVVPALSADAPKAVSNPALAIASLEDTTQTGVPPPRAERPPQHTNGARSGVWRTAAWTLGATGLGALAVGGWFGLRAFSAWDERNRACPGERCTDDGVRAGEHAANLARTADWTMGAGAVAVGAAVLMWLGSESAPRSRFARALESAGVDGAGRIVVGGRF